MKTINPARATEWGFLTPAFWRVVYQYALAAVSGSRPHVRTGLPVRLDSCGTLNRVKFRKNGIGFHIFTKPAHPNPQPNYLDLLIEADDVIYPVEIKKTASPSVQATQQLAASINTGKTVGPGAGLCLTPRDVPMSAGVTAIPMAYLWFKHLKACHSGVADWQDVSIGLSRWPEWVVIAGHDPQSMPLAPPNVAFPQRMHPIWACSGSSGGWFVVVIWFNAF